MAASTTDVREWAKAQGYDVGDKGRLPGKVKELYAAEHEPPPGGGGQGPADLEDLEDAAPGAADPVGPGEADYDGGVTEADFPPDDGGPAEPAPRAAERAAAEQPPRPVATRRGGRKKFTERLWGGEQAAPKRAPKKHARVPLTALAEDSFLDLAWTFQMLPPLEKILYLQAPMAGEVVEDTVRGTAVDKWLQPVARADLTFKKLEALTAPGWVAAIILKGQKDERGEYSPATKLMFSGLRHALLSMSRVTNTDFDEMQRKADDLRTASGQIDRQIAWLFEMPELTPEQEAAMRDLAEQVNGQR